MKKFEYEVQKWRKIIMQEMTLGLYLDFLEDNEEGIKKIFWKNLQYISETQMREIITDIMGLETRSPDIVPKKKNEENETEKIHILEGQVMHHLHQARSEIRNWELSYFFKTVSLLPVMIGNMEYKEYLERDKPDKKALKDLANNQN